MTPLHDHMKALATYSPNLSDELRLRVDRGLCDNQDVIEFAHTVKIDIFSYPHVPEDEENDVYGACMDKIMTSWMDAGSAYNEAILIISALYEVVDTIETRMLEPV